MTVYVDNARNPYGRMVMSHMLADTEAELHRMAERIGIRRAWFQAHASAPYYHVSQTKRSHAVAAGAVEIDRDQTVALIQRLRARRAGD